MLDINALGRQVKNSFIKNSENPSLKKSLRIGFCVASLFPATRLVGLVGHRAVDLAAVSAEALKVESWAPLTATEVNIQRDYGDIQKFKEWESKLSNLAFETTSCALMVWGLATANPPLILAGLVAEIARSVLHAADSEQSRTPKEAVKLFGKTCYVVALAAGSKAALITAIASSVAAPFLQNPGNPYTPVSEQGQSPVEKASNWVRDWMEWTYLTS